MSAAHLQFHKLSKPRYVFLPDIFGTFPPPLAFIVKTAARFCPSWFHFIVAAAAVVVVVAAAAEVTATGITHVVVVVAVVVGTD